MSEPIKAWISNRLFGGSSPLPPHILAAAVLIVSLLWFFVFSKNKKKSNKSSQVPWAAETSLFETIRQLSSHNGPWFLLDQAKQVGSSVFRLNLPSGGLYVVGRGDLVREVLTDPGSEKCGYFAGKSSKTTGSLNMFNSLTTDAHWKLVRRGTAPAFSTREVERMNQVCAKHCLEWMEHTLEPLANSNTDSNDNNTKTAATFDPGMQMTRLTMRVVCDAAFEYHATNEEIDLFLHHVAVCLREFSVEQLFNPIRRKLEFLFPAARRAYASAQIVQNFARNILKAYREKSDSDKSSSKTVIRLIIENEHLTDHQRVGEVGMYLIAGYDTTGYSVSNAIVALAKNPDAAKKLRNELKQAEKEHAAHEEDPVKAWRKCDYLHYVIRENFRHFPVAALGSLRCLNRDLVYSEEQRAKSNTKENNNSKDETEPMDNKTDNTSTTKIIPKGAFLLMPQLLIHRDETVFDKPNVFDPDRWATATPEMTSNLLTFALGARNCIGQALASAEIQCILAYLFRKYEFEVVEPGQPDFFMTLKVAGCRLSVKQAAD